MKLKDLLVEALSNSVEENKVLKVSAIKITTTTDDRVLYTQYTIVETNGGYATAVRNVEETNKNNKAGFIITSGSRKSKDKSYIEKWFKHQYESIERENERNSK